MRELSVPTVDPFVIASGEVRATRSIEVEVQLRALESGALEHGFGEGACLPPVTREDQPDALEAARRAGPTLVGRAFAEFDTLLALLDAALHDRPVARSAIEVAVLDAWSRLHELPLASWVSPTTVDTQPFETDITIPILPPRRMAELATQWWARGFRSLKIKVGRDLDADLRALEAILRATPQARFRPDANGGLSVNEAVTFVGEAARLGAHIECFEQPCASLEELAEVAARIEAPVIADESVKTMADFERLVHSRAALGINLKIAKSGSWLRAFELGRAAKALKMPVMVGGMVETRLGMTAAAHLAAALGGVAFADLDTAWLLERDPYVGGYLGEGAVYSLPSSPGLAVTRSSRTLATPRHALSSSGRESPSP